MATGFPFTYEQAQDLHLAIGMAVEEQGDWRAALDDALSIVSTLVSDLDPDNSPAATAITPAKAAQELRKGCATAGR